MPICSLPPFTVAEQSMPLRPPSTWAPDPTRRACSRTLLRQLSSPSSAASISPLLDHSHWHTTRRYISHVKYTSRDPTSPSDTILFLCYKGSPTLALSPLLNPPSQATAPNKPPKWPFSRLLVTSTSLAPVVSSVIRLGFQAAFGIADPSCALHGGGQPSISWCFTDCFSPASVAGPSPLHGVPEPQAVDCLSIYTCSLANLSQS